LEHSGLSKDISSRLRLGQFSRFLLTEPFSSSSTTRAKCRKLSEKSYDNPSQKSVNRTSLSLIAILGCLQFPLAANASYILQFETQVALADTRTEDTTQVALPK